jgi:1-deoxy-D-xylulose-5-phosphate synthase
VRPLDNETLRKIAHAYEEIITVEENVISGGFGEQVTRVLANDFNFAGKIKIIALPDQFIPHGTRGELLNELGLSAEKISI